MQQVKSVSIRVSCADGIPAVDRFVWNINGNMETESMRSQSPRIHPRIALSTRNLCALVAVPWYCTMYRPRVAFSSCICALRSFK